MADPTPNPFDDDVVAAIKRHMNDDHADDSRVIVQAFGGHAAVTEATMTGMDGDGIDFRAVLDEGQPVDVRVPWSERLTERAQVRVEVVRLYDEACVKLGLPGRDAAEH